MGVLNKRILRDFKHNIGRYFVIFLLFVLGIMIFVAVANSADSINTAVKTLSDESNCEDGNFSLFVPLNNAQASELEEKGVFLEEAFYIDSRNQDTELTIRIYKNREKINLLQIAEGRQAKNDKEIVIEQHYAELNNLKINDSFYIGDEEFNIVGFGYVIDYDSLFEKGDGAYPDFEKFALTFVSEKQFKKLQENNKTEYYYSYLLKNIENGFDNDDLYRWLNEMEFDENQISDIYMKEIVDKVNDEIQDFKDGADAAFDGAIDIQDGAAELNTGIIDISDGMAGLSKGINNLSQGIDMLGGSIPELVLGANGIKTGANNLKEGIDNLQEGAENLSEGSMDLKAGVEDLREAVYELAEEYITVEWSNLITFIKADDNSRITNFSKNAETNKNCAMPMGVVLFFILSFLIATIAITDIKKQYRIVGTLYAMGYNEKELTGHFIIVPTMVVFFSSICGSVLGFIVTPYFMSDYVAGGSLTAPLITMPVYLIIYGMVAPVVIAFCVNWFVIRHSLSKPALSMLRNEISESKKYMANMNRFHIRFRYQVGQLIREGAYYLLLFISLSATIFLMVFGISLYGTLVSWRNSCGDTIGYEYKYYYKFPPEEKPIGGEEAFEKEMRVVFKDTGKELKMELIGIKDTTKYFDCDVSECDEDEIIISSSVQDKFGWNIGDVVNLSIPNENQYYKFTVVGTMHFAYGLYVFTNIQNMRELFGEEEDYWNMMFSDSKLIEDENRLATTITKDDCIIGAQERTNSLMGIVYILSCMGVVIFIGMLYIMMNIITEKAQYAISTLKVIGYRQGEVVQLYLLNSLIVVCLSSLISIPVSLAVVAKIFQNIIANVPNGMLVMLPKDLYCFLLILIATAWLVIFGLMCRKVKKVSPLDILKTQE